MKDSIARRIVIKGLVQGIGYRPFVAELAEKYQITGWVRNTAGIVTVMAVGEECHMQQFLSVLSEEKPIGARIESIEIKNIEPEPIDTSCYQSFVIEVSEEESDGREIPYIPPDLPTCKLCNSQLLNKADRRYRYPFISCTACGPRYSIIERLPYDRDTITMKEFEMCKECAEEYSRKGDMRRHAQTIACHKCGPTLEFISVNNDRCSEAEKELKREETALQETISCLLKGGIVAIKDIGGFHLACSPYNEKAVEKLRLLKGREKKPFAIMFPKVESVREHCQVSEAEEEQLLSPPRPIVLLRKRTQCEVTKKCEGEEGSFSKNVCGNSHDIGAMLPCNPVQILLAGELGPLIMTSANCSGEPMLIDNEEMLNWMKEGKVEGIPLGILCHDRKILTPLDDSIVRIVAGYRQVFRRARGMVPAPISLPSLPQSTKESSATELFAAGGDLKACFCFAAGNTAYLSQHFGDLEDEGCYRQYEKEISRMKQLFGFAPQREIVDMHPAYVSAVQSQKRISSDKVCRIQHHHAHGASVIAEHGLKGKVLCITFDGTGYGVDNTIWGSEFFLWDEKEMKRVAHLKPVDLIGGNEGAKNTDTILYGYLASFEETFPEIPGINIEHFKIIQAALKQKINSVTSSSMGRLFDALSALLDICHYNSYEGEAPIELEYLAGKAQKPYPLQITLESVQENLLGDTKSLFQGLIQGLIDGIPKEELALGVILAVADFVCNTCKELEKTLFDKNDKKQIALSGGTFQNRILLEWTVKQLKAEGYLVYVNEQVPAGDGGICLGQAYLGRIEMERNGG